MYFLIALDIKNNFLIWTFPDTFGHRAAFPDSSEHSEAFTDSSRHREAFSDTFGPRDAVPDSPTHFLIALDIEKYPLSRLQNRLALSASENQEKYFLAKT